MELLNKNVNSFSQELKLKMTLGEFLELVIVLGNSSRVNRLEACENWNCLGHTIKSDDFMHTDESENLFKNCKAILRDFGIVPNFDICT